MAHLDRSTLDHLGFIFSPEYDPAPATPLLGKVPDPLVRYMLPDAALEVERSSREARLRLREIDRDLLGDWSEEAAA